MFLKFDSLEILHTGRLTINLAIFLDKGTLYKLNVKDSKKREKKDRKKKV